jgi:hypothetical protein
MFTLQCRNVQQVLPAAVALLRSVGVERDSRAGRVLVAPGPVTTLYERPEERALFYPERDANPFFHLMESLWMVAGRDDAAWLARYNARIGQFAEDDGRFHGAYGWRWKGHFGLPQIDVAVDMLRKDPTTRRVILAMWDAVSDLGVSKRDLPCNAMIHLQRNPADERLDMTVFCRSNDVLWGCYGSDSFNLSFLQEYVAARAGIPLGRYWQVSDNWHGYLDTVSQIFDMAPMENPYEAGEVRAFPLVQDPEAWEADMAMFVDEGTRAIGYREPFFRCVAVPMARAWDAFKTDSPQRHLDAIGEVTACYAPDLRRAGREWLTRKRDRWIKTRG